jgi:hypothetical protein
LPFFALLQGKCKVYFKTPRRIAAGRLYLQKEGKTPAEKESAKMGQKKENKSHSGKDAAKRKEDSEWQTRRI